MILDISTQKCTKTDDFIENSHLDRRSRYSLKMIKEALLELLHVKSLDEITVVDVCKTADINRGTFYKYYRDVPDLYAEIEDGFVNKIHALLIHSDNAKNDFPFDFEKILTILTNDAEFVYVAKNKPYSSRIVQKLLKYFIPCLHQWLKKECPGISIVNEELLVQYILGGCSKTISWWIEDGMQIPVEEVNKILTKTIKFSISVAK